MRILNPTPANLKLAVRLIKAGGVIVYPTDTAYAIGGRFDSPAVRSRILRIKGRQDSKFTLVAASQRQAVRHFPQLQATSYQQLATSNWPGPLSIIVSPRFAIRVPNNRLARQLCQLAGTPLIASSANISGQPTCYSVREFLRQIRTSPVRHRYAQALAGWPRPSFRKERDSKTSPLKEGGSERGVDLILDAGRLPRRPVSTVVRVKRGKVEVVRSGTVKF